jgi:hypothetical protein
MQMQSMRSDYMYVCVVHVIVLSGAGAGFCGGYDLVQFAENGEGSLGSQNPPYDALLDYQLMRRNTDDFMSLWYSLKPTYATQASRCNTSKQADALNRILCGRSIDTSERFVGQYL